MATFLLVHGAWHGSWCWQRVRRLLRAAGHEVITPTLTGLAERSHLLAPQVDLGTHVADVTNLLRWEDLEGVVLCGHSYGGIVATAAADAMPQRIAALVYLDAFIPQHGDSLFALVGEEQGRAFVDLAAREGEGWRVPPFFTAEMFGVNPDDRAWVDRQQTPQPLATLTQSVCLSGAIEAVPRSYVYASGWNVPQFAGFYAQARRAGWRTREIDGGHDLMIDRPEQVAAALLESLP